MNTHAIRSQRGVTMIMVMLLMTAMLMGALAFARVTEVGTLVSNNLATKESSMHAAEVGRGAAFAQLQALAALNSLDNNSGSWYWAAEQPLDPATGIPTTVNFANTPQVAGNVGRFIVTYAVERLCAAGTTAIDDSAAQCLTVNKTWGDDKGDPPDMSSTPKDYMEDGAVQYRISVRVTDVRGTQTWTQSLVTLR
jgi:type IV pilus assembly protein PilX